MELREAQIELVRLMNEATLVVDENNDNIAAVVPIATWRKMERIHEEGRVFRVT